MALARTFLRWCDRRNIGPRLDLEEEFALLRRSYPATYGKVQDTHSARRLTHAEASALLALCSDGTWEGSRDQIAIRLGLLGIRVAEICRLTWGDLQPDGTLAWIGKGRKPRSGRPGPTFLGRLEQWKAAYERGLGGKVQDSDALLCRMTAWRKLEWGQSMGTDTYRRLLQKRASAANLGHLSPHDLRRTTAKLLHSARSSDGGHLFDTEDIRVVLGHSRIDTTQRYIDAMDTAAIDRAAPILDLD